MTVDVVKYTYEFEPGYELVLENVKDLGVFLEIEYKGQVPDEEVVATKTLVLEKIRAAFIEFYSFYRDECW